jgi:hypothetical protein
MSHEKTEAEKYDKVGFFFRNETIGGLAYVVLLAFFVVKGIVTAPFRAFRR